MPNPFPAGRERFLCRVAAVFLCLGAAVLATGCAALSLRARQVLRTAGDCQFPSLPVGSQPFEAALDAATATIARSDTAAKLLQNGDETYPVMLQLIASAQKRISLETYIVGKDDITDRFFQALRDAARRGVEVRLVADAAGFHRGRIADLGDMAAPHLQARIFNPLFLSWTIIRGNNRNHRKILVVDGHYAVMGGINLSQTQEGDGISGWRDSALLVAGPVAVDAERIFAETWEQAGRGWLGKTLPLSSLNPIKRLIDAPLLQFRESVLDRPLFSPPPYEPPENPDVFPADFYDTHAASVRAIGSSPEAWASLTHDATVLGIQGARERIDAAYAYFVPPREARLALLAAARRGVAVRLLLPGVTDVRWVREIGMRFYGELLEAGVEIYEWPHPILHAKTLAVDGQWLAVGSANMDGRSYFLNYEALFAASDGKLAEAAHRQFEKDLTEARRLTLAAWRQRGFRQRLLETVLIPVAGQY